MVLSGNIAFGCSVLLSNCICICLTYVIDNYPNSISFSSHWAGQTEVEPTHNSHTASIVGMDFNNGSNIYEIEKVTGMKSSINVINNVMAVKSSISMS